VLGLRAVADLAASGCWDRVIVDCASTADALRMLTLPAAFAVYVDRSWPRHRRLSAGMDDTRSAAVAALVESVHEGLSGLAELLTDDTRVGAHVVLTAERVVAAETVRALASLAVMGVRVSEVIVNQVLFQDDSYEYRNLPEHPAFGWYSARIAEQQEVLDELAAAVGLAPQRLVVTGGGSKSAPWIQALADVTGRPVDVVAVPEGAALGAAFMARCTAGLERSTTDARRWARTSHRVEPDPAWREPCDERYERFVGLTAEALARTPEGQRS
jgi:anion-transporting  ArsA/GET3 family ATPase